MNRIIIYGSQYGTTKKYAEELAKRINVQAISYDKNEDLSKYDSIIYFGAIYAGGITGMAKTFKNVDNITSKEVFLITVGLADPTDRENIEHIDGGIKRQVSSEVFDKLKIFHLRGGIDYSKLGFLHRTMMKLLYNKAKNLPEEKQNVETRAMIDTYNKKVDFVDFDKLEEIIRELK